MATGSTPFPLSNIVSACIVGGSLLGAALILAQRPSVSADVSAPISLDARPKVAPPIAQESVANQFHDQILGSDEVRVLTYNHKSYPLADVKVKQVIYTAKDDSFTVEFDWVWKDAMPFDHPTHDVASLSNDGYGHYYGSAIWRSEGDADFKGKSADVNIR